MEFEGAMNKYGGQLLLTLLCISYKSHAIAGRTARCRCTFRYLSKFTAASRGSLCDSTFLVFIQTHHKNSGKSTIDERSQ